MSDFIRFIGFKDGNQRALAQDLAGFLVPPIGHESEGPADYVQTGAARQTGIMAEGIPSSSPEHTRSNLTPQRQGK